jgi:hypothetical protein
LPLRRPIKIVQIDDIYKSPIYLYQFKWWLGGGASKFYLCA